MPRRCKKRFAIQADPRSTGVGFLRYPLSGDGLVLLDWL